MNTWGRDWKVDIASYSCFDSCRGTESRGQCGVRCPTPRYKISQTSAPVDAFLADAAGVCDSSVLAAPSGVAARAACGEEEPRTAMDCDYFEDAELWEMIDECQRPQVPTADSTVCIEFNLRKSPHAVNVTSRSSPPLHINSPHAVYLNSPQVTSIHLTPFTSPHLTRWRRSRR